MKNRLSSLAARSLGLAALALVTGAGSCTRPSNNGGGPPPIEGFEREAMVANLVDNLILPTLRDFDAAAGALESATAAYASTLRESPANATAERDAARQAWLAAMALWQQAELMQVGPAGTPGIMMGGEGLRDEIYSWPTVNPCAVDQQIVANEFGEDGFFDRKLVNVYGLDALEYVLFAPDAGNACPAPATINSQGQWAALSEAEIWQRRADYAAAAARHLKADAATLRGRWEPDEGNFRKAIVEPGSEGSPYGSITEAIDQLFAGMFYVELRVKDRKLAIPLGIHVDCPTETCPDQLESRFSKTTKENILVNLRTYQRFFLGAEPGQDGVGFQDYLVAVKANDLATDMGADAEAALATFTSFEGTIEDRLLTDTAAVTALHAAVKQVTDDLKSQFVTVLNLEVPQEGAGDND